MVFEWNPGISPREAECRASPAATRGPWKTWKRRNCSGGRSRTTGMGCASPPWGSHRRTRGGLEGGGVSAGILDGSLIHPREVFAAAVRERAAAVLLLHNHPSGDPAPSGQDREVTRRLRSAGGILGIPGADPVILGA